jgi:hypothetical protein
MLGWIHEEHHLADRLEALGTDVVDVDAAGVVGEGLMVASGRADVGVPREGPEERAVVGGVAVDGIVGAEPAELIVRLSVGEGGRRDEVDGLRGQI